MSSSRPGEELKKLVVDRGRGCCEYCLSLRSFSASPFVIDLIVPAVAGGLTEVDNLCLSCAGCNGHKQAATTEREHRLDHPWRDRWSTHFAWSPDRLFIVGLNLREILARDGVHPPEYPYEGEPDAT